MVALEACQELTYWRHASKAGPSDGIWCWHSQSIRNGLLPVGAMSFHMQLQFKTNFMDFHLSPICLLFILRIAPHSFNSSVLLDSSHSLACPSPSLRRNPRRLRRRHRHRNAPHHGRRLPQLAWLPRRLEVLKPPPDGGLPELRESRSRNKSLAFWHETKGSFARSYLAIFPMCTAYYFELTT